MRQVSRVWGFVIASATLLALALWLDDRRADLFIRLPYFALMLCALPRLHPRLALWNMPARGLRRYPFAYGVLWNGAWVALFVAWWLTYDPAIGIPLTPVEMFWLLGLGVALWLYPFTGLTRDEARQIGERLRWRAGVLITLATVVALLIGAELGLRYLVVSSDAFQFSKMHQNWERLYWHPNNDYGYRDMPPVLDEAKTRLIVAGDSFVAGYGVNQIEDTFPHQLAALLGDGYAVNTVAVPGWGISSALQGVKDYAYAPDVLVMSHYMNDILEGEAGALYGRPFPDIRGAVHPSLTWWVDNFYIANFLRFRLFAYGQNDAEAQYAEWTRGAYDEPALWDAYQSEIKAVGDYARQVDIPLYVVVFPNLGNVAGTAPYTAKVADAFARQGARVLDLSAVYADVPVRELVVNPFDAHPSVQAHRLAAQALAELLQEAP